MAAPKGNRFWEARSSHGRNPIFASPEELWNACTEYFDWVEENPLYETKAFHNQGDVTYATLPKIRAMTISGLCIFLGIASSTWCEYKKNNKKHENGDDFSSITMRVEEIIRDQKFSGAAADLLNANIIARDLGLKDKQEVEQTGKLGGAIAHDVKVTLTHEELSKLTPQELSRLAINGKI